MKDLLIEGTVALEKVKRDIITGTLDTMNGVKKKDEGCSQSQTGQTYELCKSLLSSTYAAKGVVVSSKG